MTSGSGIGHSVVWTSYIPELDNLPSVSWEMGAILGVLGVAAMVFLQQMGVIALDEFIDRMARRLGPVPVVGPRIEGVFTDPSKDAEKEAREAKEEVQGLKKRLEESEAETEAELAKETITGQGFNHLERGDFEEGTLDEEYCWRRPFTFREVHEGIPIEREYPSDERRRLTTEVLETLSDGGAALLLGTPGAGKTTTARQIASKWFSEVETGPVLYRTERVDRPARDPEALVEAIQYYAKDGPVLVIAEDAAREDTLPLHEVLHDLRGDDEVSFLFTSRESEWGRLRDRMHEHEAFDPTTDRGEDILATRADYLQRHQMPGLDEQEVQRILDRFEEETGHTSPGNAGVLLDHIRAEHGANPMLLLSYYLPIGPGDTDVDGNKSALATNVEEAYREITAPDEGEFAIKTSDDEELFDDLSLLINVLNASGIGVYEELLHALADEPADHDRIDRMVADLEGILLFGEETGTRYWSHHERWSELYLERHLEVSGERQARKQFERVVNALLGLCTDEEHREQIQQHFGHPSPKLENITENSIGIADLFVTAIFGVGHERPPLRPLFGASGYSGIDVREPCSSGVWVRTALWRSDICEYVDNYPQAAEELSVVEGRIGDTGVEKAKFDIPIATRRGHLALNVGEYGEARSHFERSLDIAQKVDDRQGKAASLNNLGSVALQQGAFEQAREYHEQSLEIKRDLGNRQDEASSLNNLGTTALQQGAFEEAWKYYEQSLGIARDLGDRQGEAKSLNNLGLVAKNQGSFEQAREYFEQSLEIKRDLGDRRGEANSLDNLGLIARSQGAFEQALEYHEQSLKISRDLSDRQSEASSFGNLGSVALQQGAFEQAQDYYEQSLEIARDLGNRQDEATNLEGLGLVARHQGAFEQAREYHEQSLKIKRDLGDRNGEAQSLNNLGSVAGEQGDHDAAAGYFEQAVGIYYELGTPRSLLNAKGNLAIVHEHQGAPAKAIDVCQEALAVIEQADIPGLADEKESFQKRLARLEGSTDTEEEP